MPEKVPPAVAVQALRDEGLEVRREVHAGRCTHVALHGREPCIMQLAGLPRLLCSAPIAARFQCRWSGTAA